MSEPLRYDEQFWKFTLKNIMVIITAEIIGMKNRKSYLNQ